MNTHDVSFLPNGKLKTKTKHLFDDDSSTEDSGESTTNSDNSTNGNNLLKNMNTEQSLPNGRLGVFPPVYKKIDSRKFFEEVPYTYGRFNTTPKALVESHTENINKKSIYPDLEYNTASYNHQSTQDTSRTTDEMTLANNTFKSPMYPTLTETKINYLDKTTVKIDSETSLNEKTNITDETQYNANVNTTEETKETGANPSSANIPSSPLNNKILLKDNNNVSPVRVPVNINQYKPYKDVLSRAVKFYKDFAASTPSSYLDMNVINIPLLYKIGDNKHVHFPENPINHKEQDKNAKLLKETNPTSFMEVPFSSRPKVLQYVTPSVGNIFSLANNPFTKNRDAQSIREENMKETIVSNILNVMREILPTPMNFTIVNFAK